MLCKCGCGAETKPGNIYINGHNRRGIKYPKRQYSRRRCACGCGEMAPPNKKYIHGHNARVRSAETIEKQKATRKKNNKQMSIETRKKISQTVKQQWKDPSARRKKIKGILSANATEEVKEKRRKATKKRWENPELAQKMKKQMKGTKLGISPWIKGKRHTNLAKTKMSKALKGRIPWNKDKECPQLAGPNNPAWAGGIKNFPYCFSWDEITKAIKEKYKWECQNPFCDGKCKAIVTHHINYDKQDCDGKNLITLCSSCNTKANRDREWHQAFYEEIKRRVG
jgi:hypothetical protein